MWIDECRGHPECGSLNWSTKNPTRLVRILPAHQLQLVNIRDQEWVDYSALSYCWGGEASGKTLKENLETRAQSFHLDDLPRTIKDAISLTRGAGLSYICVDSVYIVQKYAEDWARESTLMQEVYANACATICASSATKASAGLFGEWAAWKYSSQPCMIDHCMYWLSIVELPFDTLVDQSTRSRRAWTLQEEYLSPRLLYWTL
jgi:hypothetical protein